ncbi:MAG: alpha-1,2-fucosyltransferase [Mucilaginibacter sp.]|jgi:hypothetical protein|uniref:alpha-1,2-fucosyltransferase n=1 Tax=Mucilaginibacter sp. TaxID=1882438 RepID=UPI003567C752
MFQYAFARALSPDRMVLLDLSFLEGNNISTASFTSRTYRLGIFNNINAQRFTGFQNRVVNRGGLYYRLLKKMIYPGIKNINDQNAALHQISEFKNDQVLYADGYFQNEKYFGHIRALLLHEFRLPDVNGKSARLMDDIKACNNAVAVHVRRGDYLKPGVSAYHGVLPLAYYKNAVALIERSVAGAHYFIFSDDMDWCVKNMTFLTKATFTNTDGIDWADLALMSSCRHQVIANSSYSWWAAWLNQRTDKMVIAPEKWFADKQSMELAGDIVPDQWIRI